MQPDLPKTYSLADHDAHARSVAPDAYWQQVRRTVNGKPVDDAQIAMIVAAITRGLALQPDDVVLDLACGNGALSSYLFDECAGFLGVDSAPYLIEVASRDFGRPPHYRFICDDVASYVAVEPAPEAFTKALIYGAFQCFSRADAITVLRTLGERFASLRTVFIGNVPDKSRHGLFYRDRTPSDAELNDHEARLGIWYEAQELGAIAAAAGWTASFSQMRPDFYGAHYRFDVTLQRSAS